ncbi:hypothetical protein BKA62DRAFT_770243 [Auriculariales sp. MPI-PUGE-AT-0066]|nr:hypothetical protein BKA62DRAFT_770243 [Auriculariales sp. MPI-PUGE-AT-0066]
MLSDDAGEPDAESTQLSFTPALNDFRAATRRALEQEYARHSAFESQQNSSEIVQKTMIMIRRHLDDTIALFAEEHNQSSGSARGVARLVQLPELLFTIFGHLESVSDRIAASQVCRSWRTGALAAPALLWATIASHSQAEGVLTKRIDRVPKHVPLALSVWVSTSTWKEVACVLEENLSHIRILWLRMDDSLEESGEQASQAIRRALARAAPYLSATTGPFAGIAPRLSLVKFYGQLDVLRSLPSTVDRVMFSQAQTTTVEILRQFFEYFDSSTALCVELDGWEVPDVAAAPVQISSNLQTLFIEKNNSEIELPNVLSLIPHTALLNVAVHYRKEDTDSNAVTAFEVLVSTIDTSLDHMDVLHLPGDETHIEAFLQDGRRRYLGNIKLRWTVARAMVADLRHLRISETLLVSAVVDQGPYDLGSIVQLGIILTPAHHVHRSLVETSIFAMPRQRGCWFRAPALHTLTILPSFVLDQPAPEDSMSLSARGAIVVRCAVGPEMLHELLEWHFDLDVGRKLRLILHRVGLVTHDLKSVARLLEQVEDLRIEEDEQVIYGLDEEVSPFNELHSWDSDSRFPLLDQL